MKNTCRVSVTILPRCTCVLGEVEGTAMADCVIAEDSDFCRCIVENEGNSETVRWYFNTESSSADIAYN